MWMLAAWLAMRQSRQRTVSECLIAMLECIAIPISSCIIATSKNPNVPLCALSLLSIMECRPLFTAPLPSPRLDVNTFKHTLRGGISSSLSVSRRRFLSVTGQGRVFRKERIKRIEGTAGISSKICRFAESFAEKRCEVWKHRSQTSPGTG